MHRLHVAQAADPIAHGGVSGCPIARCQHGGQHAKQRVIPVIRARDDARMVILQKPPDLPQHGQVLDLHLRQFAEDDARIVETERLVEIRCE